MKKLIAVILSALILLSVVPAVVIAAPTADEVGKVATGYTPSGTGIDDLSQITDINGSYYLTKDVTASATIESFKGTLDGNGHTVTVSAPLFAELQGTVKNLTVSGTVSAPGTSENTGALAKIATAALTLENVKNAATVTGVLDDATDLFATGGLVGKTLGDLALTNCANTAVVTGQSVGGLVGYIFGDVTATFKGCVNTGKITNAGAGTNTKYAEPNGDTTISVYFGIGGVVGSTNGKTNISFDDCANSGVIAGEAVKIPAGGILGYTHVDNLEEAEAAKATFKACTNTADVTGGWQTGGIGGWVKIPSDNENCTNSGKILSTQSYCGGIHGRVGTDNDPLLNTFKNCKNTGEVVGYTSQTGGILGYAAKIKLVVEGCINTGKIAPVNGSAGGIIGNFSTAEACSITNCTNSGEIVGAAGKKGCVAGIIGKFTGDPSHVEKVIIENCKNTGKVTGNNDADTWGGGICGYIADGVVEVNNVSNEAEIYSKHYCAGIVGRFGANDKEGYFTITKAVNKGKVGSGKGDCAGILAFSTGHIKITNCINTGYIYNDTLRVGGIYGSPNGETSVCSILIDKCFNFGELKGFGRVGGIAAALGNNAEKDAYVIQNCVNYGTLTVDIASGSHYIGGIAGYGWGGGGSNGILNCQNYGTINVTAPEGDYSGTIITAGIIGYFNTSTYNLRDCLNAGKINVKATGENIGNYQLFYNKNTTGCAESYISGNMYTGNDGITVQLNGAITDDNATAVTSADIESGAITYAFNKAAGATVLFQTIGTDKTPTPDSTSKVVYLVNGVYTNTAPVNPKPTPTGDSAVAIVLALVAVSAGAVLTMKKRVR